MPSDSVSSSAVDTPSPWNSTQRSVASLILFIHVFCIGVALAANHAPSPLQDRLLTVFRPYTQLLNFDITFVRFDLTQATFDDTDQRLEYLPRGAAADQETQWTPLEAGWHGGERHARYQRLAALMGYFGSREEDSTSAVIASSVGRHLYATQRPIDQLRCRRHLLQSPEEVVGANLDRRNPNDPSYFREVYRAQVIDFGDGQVAVQKAEERGQVAPPTRASGQPSRRSQGSTNPAGSASPESNGNPAARPDAKAQPDSKPDSKPQPPATLPATTSPPSTGPAK